MIWYLIWLLMWLDPKSYLDSTWNTTTHQTILGSGWVEIIPNNQCPFSCLTKVIFFHAETKQYFIAKTNWNFLVEPKWCLDKVVLLLLSDFAKPKQMGPSIRLLALHSLALWWFDCMPLCSCSHRPI
jgi:hypothetical protein